MKADYIVIANNERFTLKPGDILIIPPNTIHKLICPEPGIRFVFLLNFEAFSTFQDYKTIQPMLLNANLITVDDYVGKKLKKAILLFCI